MGFTDISRRTTPDRVMGMLDELYCLLDVEAEGAGLYKVETIGARGGWARGERERLCFWGFGGTSAPGHTAMVPLAASAAA